MHILAFSKRWCVALVGALPMVPAFASMNMTEGVTQISQQVYDLHMLIFYICCAIAVAVFGVMFWAILRHRKSAGVEPANFHESTKVEIVWTTIPFLILVAMAVPATQTLIEMDDTSDADLTILVTGSQWKWHYRYIDHDIEFYSLLATPQEQIRNKTDKSDTYLLDVDSPLVIPTERKVRFLLTSDDVIHSWWVPAFAVKKDAVPGFINEAWARVETSGTYRGQCAELCGKDHGFMPIVVEAKQPQAFDEWLTAKQLDKAVAQANEQQAMRETMTMQEAMALGESTYVAYCAACHQVNGEGIPGVFPALKDSAVAIGDVKKHIDVVMNGVSGTAMQAFAKQLTKKEMAAVVTYERNAWGNDTGDVVQASELSQSPSQSPE